MNPKHLDTLVGPRTPECDRLYNAMLKAYTLKMNYTLVDGDIKIGRWVDMADPNNCLYTVEYKNRNRVYDGSKLYSNVLKQYNYKPGYDTSANIDNLCRYMMNNDQRECDPWEVL
jgi:hypothetical protein